MNAKKYAEKMLQLKNDSICNFEAKEENKRNENEVYLEIQEYKKNKILIRYSEGRGIEPILFPNDSNKKRRIKKLLHDAEEYRILGCFNPALNLTNKALEIDSTSAFAARVYILRADIYDNMKKYEESMNDVNTAISLNPQYGMAYHRRAEFLVHAGYYDDALEDYKKFAECESYKDKRRVYNFYGDCYYGKGDYDNALEFYNKFIEYNGKDKIPEIHYNLGCIYTELKKYNEAVDSFEESLQQHEYYASSLDVAEEIKSCKDGIKKAKDELAKL